MPSGDAVRVDGSPAGPGRREGGAWRARVAGAVSGHAPIDGVHLLFDLEPRRWVDLDTLVEEALAGLRVGGLLAPRYAGLDAFLAQKRAAGAAPGLTVHLAGAAAVRALRPPGPTALDVGGDLLPRPGRRAEKERWRDHLARAWAGRAPLEGDVWAELRFGTARSLVTCMEPALDALEPVLGRDARGRSWQVFFPNDDRIVWLRVQRDPDGPPIRLRLGPLGAQAIDSGGASDPRSSPRAQDHA
jgi:hypothetical protein